MVFDFRGGNLRVGLGAADYESVAWRSAFDARSGSGDYECADNTCTRQDQRTDGEESGQENRKESCAEEIPC